jgi:hypothetical protein
MCLLRKILMIWVESYILGGYKLGIKPFYWGYNLSESYWMLITFVK